MDLQYAPVEFSGMLRKMKPPQEIYDFKTNPLYMGHTFRYETPTNFIGRFYVRPPSAQPDMSCVPVCKTLMSVPIMRTEKVEPQLQR